MIPIIPNEVNSKIQHLVRRGVKMTRSSRLKRLIQTKKKQDALFDLVLPRNKKHKG